MLLQDIGPVAKMPSFGPLCLDVPYMQFIREKYIKSVLNHRCSQQQPPHVGHTTTPSSLTPTFPSAELMYLQRCIRADIVSKGPDWGRRHLSSLTASAEVPLRPADMFYRSRKQNKREWKVLEKELRKKRTDKDEAKRCVCASVECVYWIVCVLE